MKNFMNENRCLCCEEHLLYNKITNFSVCANRICWAKTLKKDAEYSIINFRNKYFNVIKIDYYGNIAAFNKGSLVYKESECYETMSFWELVKYIYKMVENKDIV